MLQSFSSCDSWQCFNSFALWISSLGTISVSIIALRLSYQDKKIRLNAQFSHGFFASASNDLSGQMSYLLKFTNIGARPVTIQSVHWRLPFNKSTVITFPHNHAKYGFLCTKLPVEITDGKHGEIFYPSDFFRTLENKEDFIYPKNKLLAWFRIKRVKLVIDTSVGKKIKVNIPSYVKRELWKEYLNL